MADRGNSNQITRDYLDSLLIESRYLNSDIPSTELTLYGRTFPTPIMTAALSHLDHFMFPGALKAYAEGTAAAGAVLWLGMAGDEDIQTCADSGAGMVEIIKPYADRDQMYRRMEQAERLGLLAVGVDIDHSFGNDGSYDVVHDDPMRPLTSAELSELVRATKLPFIVKGVLSVRDAETSLACGAQGILLSHHNNRVPYAVPPLYALPEIARMVGGRAPIFVDCEISSGADAFKALALGATAVGVGRPLMTAIKDNGAQGVTDWLNNATAELRKLMAFTGCTDLGKMDPTVIHPRNF